MRGLPTRYGGIDARIELFRSSAAQAVSVSVSTWLIQFGVAQSAGHPDQGTTRGGPVPSLVAATLVTVTPCGSPGTAAGGPTVAGGTVAGSLPFAGTSKEDRCSTRISPDAVRDSTGCNSVT